MSETTPALTKTCIICGQLKPLSAFLEISGPDGSHYGSVCSTCRKAYIEMLKNEGDDTSRRMMDLSIGPEERLAIERERVQFEKEEKEQNEKQRKEKDELSKSKIDESKTVTNTERKRREGFLNKSSFLDRKPETPIEKTFGYEEAKEKQAPDLSVPIQDAQVRKLERTVEFNRFRAWLGKDAPINRNVEKKVTDSKENVIDYVNKNFKKK